MKTISYLIILILCHTVAIAQQSDSSFYNIDISKYVQLDSMTVIASKKGFSVNDFIDLVKMDTTFAEAFYNMRIAPFRADNRFEFYDAKMEKKLASAKWDEEQYYKKECRWCTSTYSESDGNFYRRNGSPRYYTSTLFSRAFYSREKRCGERPGAYIDIQSLSGMSKRMEQLKRVIFNPGSSIDDAPIIGKRMAIFNEEMVPFYDYSIQTSFTQDSIECYVFTVREKKDLKKSEENRVILKSMESWFQKSNFQIISRQYHLKSNSFLYSFDVSMNVSLQLHKGRYFLKQILYDGIWDIPTKKPENAKATIDFQMANDEEDIP